MFGRPTPKSIADDDVTFSGRLTPREVRLAEGDPDGDAGEPEMRERRFPGMAGAPGESQKKDPNPGDPEKEEPPEKAGEAVIDVLRGIAGESMSIPPSEKVDLGENEDNGSV